MSEMPCATYSCPRPGSMRCPTCVSVGVTPESLSYFCSQDCFRKSWKTHKAVHKNGNLPQEDTHSSLVAQEKLFEGFQFTGPLRVAEVVMPLRTVPTTISRPDYADHPRGIPLSEEKSLGSSAMISVLFGEEVIAMRTACRLAREVLDIGIRAAKPGVTTEEIDLIVHQACMERNCYPSPLNYYGFPKSCCTSVNEVICHGIPDRRPLQNGDILNIDISVYHNGYHGDLNETILIGENVDEASKKLVRSAHDAMWSAIRMVKPGVMFREFGAAIEKVARSRGHTVVRSYCGHGVGKLFHSAPTIPHYKKNKAVGVVREGMTFTIEPMLCANGWKDVTWPDNWTAVTEDGGRSAQFEHTILVTSTGYEVLTARTSESPKLWWEEEVTGSEGA